MYPVRRRGLDWHRYAAETGEFSYVPPEYRSNSTATQAPSSRSSESGFAFNSPASAAADFGPAASASKTPSATAANIVLERRKASRRSRIGAGSGAGA